MRLLLIIVCLLESLFCLSQINVSAAFDADTVLIGDPVTYTLTIKVGRGIDVKSINQTALDSIISGVQTHRKNEKDSLEVPDLVVSDYEINSFGRWKNEDNDGVFQGAELSFDTTIVGSEILLENTFDITFWDPGPQSLRHPSLSFLYADSLYQYPYSGVSEVFIAPPFDLSELESDSIDIADIKPILKEEKNITDYYHIIILITGLLGLALIWFLWTKVRNRGSEVINKEIKVKPPAHVIALDRLHDLKEEELWQKGQIKEYQSKLTFAIREYLENRYDIQALESTTDEITRELNTHNFTLDDEVALKEILQVADLVKFAKATPELSVHERFLGKAMDFVNKTKHVVIDQEDITEE